MLIIDHKLYLRRNKPVSYLASPNHGGQLDCKFLVFHYTASTEASALQWFQSRESQVSAHILINRKGQITQLVPLDKVAWHAGRSFWKGFAMLNYYAIGIEFENAGQLLQNGRSWRSWYGASVPKRQVIEAVHKHDSMLSGWHKFTKPQLKTARKVAEVLMETYPIREIIGHDDIAPHRKLDPGPAFPMKDFQKAFTLEKAPLSTNYSCTAPLNIRSGPGTTFMCIIPEALPKNTQVVVLEEHQNWGYVKVIGRVNGDDDIQGWVHRHYLKKL
ncbi:N-acetylmuramoyl-L-alanine amidase [Rapidithrix thailandica]|uniref:N-acetylmuramoyl-L-alanine amidase n=1 Tax=Rapidithrix thailandica TaxID=413964 RepID=A0AAW9SF11_9BACT